MWDDTTKYNYQCGIQDSSIHLHTSQYVEQYHSLVVEYFSEQISTRRPSASNWDVNASSSSATPKGSMAWLARRMISWSRARGRLAHMLLLEVVHVTTEWWRPRWWQFLLFLRYKFYQDRRQKPNLLKVIELCYQNVTLSISNIQDRLQLL